MQGMDFFWILLLLLSFQPLLQQRMLQYFRQALIDKIEKLRNSRVIVIIHRQETMSFLGFPIMKFLTMEDSEAVLRALEETPDNKDIDLVLHTPGGLVLAAVQIARAIRRRKGKTRVIVPHYAMSGGTLIALAADEIIMSPNAVLGPLDPQLGQFPAPSLVKLKETKDKNEIEDKTWIMIDLAEKSMKQMQEVIIELLTEKGFEKEKAEELAKMMTEGLWTHDYPITPEKAKEMGLNVSTDIPTEFLKLMSLYKQPMQRQKSVDFIEKPYNLNKR